jgi:hypothetical protein
MWSVRCRQCVLSPTGSPSWFCQSTLSAIGGLIWLLNITNLPTNWIQKKQTFVFFLIIPSGMITKVCFFGMMNKKTKVRNASGKQHVYVLSYCRFLIDTRDLKVGHRVIMRPKKKKNPCPLGFCPRVDLFTSVQGKRDRWAGLSRTGVSEWKSWSIEWTCVTVAFVVGNACSNRSRTMSSPLTMSYLKPSWDVWPWCR